MKWKRLLCMGILLMLLAGCMENGSMQTPPSADPQPDITEPSTSVTVPETTEPQVTEPEATEPEATEPEATEPVLAAVNRLTVREVPAEATVLDHRTAVFLSTEQGSDEADKAVTRVQVLDLYTDEILAQREFDGTLTGPVQDYCPGFLPLFDYADGTCTVYDSSLKELLRFQAPDRGGVFTEDLTTYYYINAQRLFRMDIATGEAEQIVTDQALPLESIVEYDGKNGRILVNVHTQYYLTKLCVGVIDLETGQFALLSPDAAEAGFLESGIAVTPLQDEQDPGKLYLLDREDDSVQLLRTVMVNDMSTSSWHIPGSDYLISLHYYASSVRGAYNGCTLYKLSDRCESSDLGKLLKLYDLNTVLALPDGNLLALLYSRQSTEPVLICTDLLEFSPLESFSAGEFTAVDTALEESYAQQSREVEVAEELLEVRAKADALEETYSITILMSNQCRAPLENCDAQLVTTDQAGMKDEAKAIDSALRKLEAACKLYPSDFFSQFRNEADERGVLILLVQDISAGAIAEGYDVLGISFRMDDWYPIAVDISTADMTATFCHELWHATEDKINEADPTLLSDVAWYRYNPRHFTYSNNGGGDWVTDTKDTFQGGYGSESYFVDGYSKTNAYEDRARLMEYVMTSNYYSRKLMEVPALQRKMQAMANAIRKVFDTEDWKDVRWERNLA